MAFRHVISDSDGKLRRNLGKSIITPSTSIIETQKPSTFRKGLGKPIVSSSGGGGGSAQTGWGTQQTGTNTLVYAPDGFLDVCLANGFRIGGHKHLGRIARERIITRSGNGSTKYLYSVAEYNVGHIFNSDFTVECWFNPTVSDGNFRSFFSRASDNGSSVGSTFYLGYRDNLLYLGCSNGSTLYDVSVDSGLSANAWYHIALVRYNNKLAVYLNGVKQFETVTISNLIDLTDKGVAFCGGAFAEAAGVLITRCADGYYEQIRISNIARYIANFTPATTFTVD